MKTFTAATEWVAPVYKRQLVCVVSPSDGSVGGVSPSEVCSPSFVALAQFVLDWNDGILNPRLARLTLGAGDLRAHVRWNTKNDGDASRAWRVIFTDDHGRPELEINVRHVSFESMSGAVPCYTTVSQVDGELKGNIETRVRAIDLVPGTRTVTLRSA